MKQPSIQKQEASLVRTTHANLRRHHAHQSTSTEGQEMSSAIGPLYKGRTKHASIPNFATHNCRYLRNRPRQSPTAITRNSYQRLPASSPTPRAALPYRLRVKITAQKSPHAYAGFSETLSANRAVKHRRGYFFLRFADFERFDFWRCVACFVACAGCAAAATVAFLPESSAEASTEAP